MEGNNGNDWFAILAFKKRYALFVCCFVCKKYQIIQTIPLNIKKYRIANIWSNTQSQVHNQANNSVHK